MNNDLVFFLEKHGINNIEDFSDKMNMEFLSTENSISLNEMEYVVMNKTTERVIPISKLVGCNESHLSDDKSLISSFSNFFDSSKNDSYHTRGLSLLNVSFESIMKVISPSFNEEPMKTISIDNRYYIGNNGLHRFILLKLFYMAELYQGKSVQELDEKYQVKVLDREIDIFKTFANYIGITFHPPLNNTSEINPNDWLKSVENRIEKLQTNPQDYNAFISAFAFSKFINGSSGEEMLKMSVKYFSNTIKDVVKFLCFTNNYEYLIELMDVVNKYYPNKKEEYDSLINQCILIDNQNAIKENRFEFFDLYKKWDGYGEIEDISTLPKNRRNYKLAQFSEGSKTLEKCLIILWDRGIKTTACCKGNHLSINCDNIPEIECEAYISFDSNSEWQDYLSNEIIENEDVVITDNAIYYYGENHDAFFTALSKTCIIGKRDNKEVLNRKISKGLTNIEEQKLEHKAFHESIHEIGFDEEQIMNLSNGYLEMCKYMNEFYSAENAVERKESQRKWESARESFNAEVIFYISRNNDVLLTEHKDGQGFHY